MWWSTPLIPVLGKKISEFKVSLVYTVSCRAARLHSEILSQKGKRKSVLFGTAVIHVS